MSSIQQEQQSQISNCNDNGLFYEQKCQCDLGYFGKDCQENLQDIHIEAYFIYIGLFLIFFIMLLVITIKQFQISLKANKIPTYKKGISYFTNLLGSPLNCILCLTIFFCILRIIWLALDPFQLYDGRERVIERILAEVVYSILFYVYGILLMVWYTMYDEISFNIQEKKMDLNKSKNDSKCNEKSIDMRKYVFQYYKDVMKIRLFLVLIIQLIVSTLNGLRLAQEYKPILYIAYAILLLNFVSFIAEFLLYGKSLNQCIEKQLIKLEPKIYQQQTERLNIQQSQINSPISSDINILQRKRDYTEFNSEIRRNSKRNSKKKTIIKISDDNPYQQKKRREVTFLQTQQCLQYNQFSSTSRQQSDQLTKTITEESQISLKIEEIPHHQKVNSCLMDEAEADNIQNIQWQLEEEIKTQKRIKKKQIRLVEKTKFYISNTNLNCTSKQAKKKQTLKIETKDFQDANKELTEEEKKKQEQNEIEYQNDMIAQQIQIKTANLNADKRVLIQIQLLIYAGVFFEICFGVLSILILVTNFLDTSIGKQFMISKKGTLCYLYISGMLQLGSLITVLKLFSDIKSTEVLNLIWIQKIGNRKNRINQHFLFQLPVEQKNKDDSKLKFENRINMHFQ